LGGRCAHRQENPGAFPRDETAELERHPRRTLPGAPTRARFDAGGPFSAYPGGDARLRGRAEEWPGLNATAPPPVNSSVSPAFLCRIPGRAPGPSG
jgi:hypothetical protein